MCQHSGAVLGKLKKARRENLVFSRLSFFHATRAFSKDRLKLLAIVDGTV